MASRKKTTKSTNGVVTYKRKARCHMCDGTRLVSTDTKSFDYHGTNKFGERYTRIYTHRMNCKHCGAYTMAMSWDFDESLWTG